MKRLSLSFVWVAVLSGLGPIAWGQPASTLAGQVELPRLVDTAAQRLEGGLSDEELWQLANRAHLIRKAGRPSSR